MSEMAMFFGESRYIEYKREVPKDSLKYMKSVVAFANGDGGQIIFGVEDNTEKVIGVPAETLFQTMDALTNAVTDSCEPMIIPNIMVREIDEKQIIIMEIMPGMERPYFIKSKGMINGTYIRTAGTTRPADQVILQELILEGRNKFFDQEPVWHGMVADYEIDALCRQLYEIALKNAKTAEQRQAVKRVTKNTLLSWGVLAERQHMVLPTNAYSMLTNTNGLPPLIQCAVFKTENRAIFVDRREITGTVQEQIEKALQYVLEKINMGARFHGIYREDVYELPPDSLRELIANAVVHRSYLEPAPIQIALFANRLEITSPGGLMRGVTVAKMKEGFSKIRNRALASAFAYMNIIEQWGSGIPRIMHECQKYGLPELEIIDLDGDMRVNLYRCTKAKTDQKTDQKTESNPILTDNEAAIWQILLQKPSCTQKEMAGILRWKPGKIKYHIRNLQAKGRIIRVGSHRKGYWQLVQPEK